MREDLLARLPPHLHFMADVEKVNGMEADELIEFSTGYLEKLRKHRDELAACGVRIDQFIADTARRLAAVEAVNKDVEKAEDARLQAMADSADAQYDLFKAMEALVKAAKEQNPFDPQIEEWEEQLEEIRRQMPRE